MLSSLTLNTRRCWKCVPHSQINNLRNWRRKQQIGKNAKQCENQKSKKVHRIINGWTKERKKHEHTNQLPKLYEKLFLVFPFLVLRAFFHHPSPYSLSVYRITDAQRISQLGMRYIIILKLTSDVFYRGWRRASLPVPSSKLLV